MRHFLQIFVVIMISIGALNVGWSANIALLVPDGLFTIDEDPINFPEDKEFLLETIEIEQIGLHWLILHLENDLGHLVNIYSSGSDDAALVQEANDLIFISEALGSGSIGSDYRTSIKPVVFAEAYILDDMGFTNGQSEFTGDAIATEIKIVKMDHPIATGLPETFIATVLDETTGEPIVPTFSSPTNTAILADGVGEVVAVLPSSVNASDSGSVISANTPIVIAVEAGTELDQGDQAGAKWVFLGYSDDIEADFETYGGLQETRTLAILSEPAIQLLDNCIAWALGDLTNVDHWPIY